MSAYLCTDSGSPGEWRGFQLNWTSGECLSLYCLWYSWWMERFSIELDFRWVLIVVLTLVLLVNGEVFNWTGLQMSAYLCTDSGSPGEWRGFQLNWTSGECLALYWLWYSWWMERFSIELDFRWVLIFVLTLVVLVSGEVFNWTGLQVSAYRCTALVVLVNGEVFNWTWLQVSAYRCTDSSTPGDWRGFQLNWTSGECLSLYWLWYSWWMERFSMELDFGWVVYLGMGAKFGRNFLRPAPQTGLRPR